MLLDNSLRTSDRYKSPDINTPLLESRGTSPGDSMLSSARVPMLPDVPPSTPAFVPRPFPPPALAGVPVEYIIHKLHQLAQKYWDKPDTADCTIIVPIPHPVGLARRAPDMPLFTPGLPIPGSPHKQDPAGLGRRVTEPIQSAVPRVTFKLHVDYLSAQSTFLRGLFAGTNPLDLINTTTQTDAKQEHHSTPHKGSLPFNVPANRLPRLLPSSPTHPILFLPVPDPTSFHLLVHWMYFGHTGYIEDCLNRGIVQLPGITKNVAYLGLPDDIIGKFLRRWERAWKKSHLPPSPPYDDDLEFSDEEVYPYSGDEDMEVDMEEPRRGRAATTRHLSHTCQPQTLSACST